MSFLQPDATYLSFSDIDPQILLSLGVRVVLLDIDNTLAPYEQPVPDERVRAWFAELAEWGIRAAFVSNNSEERVRRFNKTLGLPARWKAKKPLAGAARKLWRAIGGNHRNTVFIGDQIFTDVLCARALGVRAFLVPPIKDRTDRGTRFKRFLERGILKRYYKLHPSAPDVRPKRYQKGKKQ